MARVINNSFTSGISGKVGRDLLFKTWKNGNTYLYQRPKKPAKQSPQQKANRMKFQMAAFFAKSMMNDPLKKAEYWEKAKQLKLPNAYTAAITEYMRNPEITQIELLDYQGNEGDEIKIKVGKKDFEVETVEVLILDARGKVIESGKAERKNRRGDWIYSALESSDLGVRITVRAMDRVGNWREKSLKRI